MSTEENKAFARRGYEASNQKNLAAFDALYASEIIFSPPIEDPPGSRSLQTIPLDALHRFP